METTAASAEKIFDKVEQYAKTNLKILELKTVAKSADVFSSLTSVLALIVVVTIFFVVLSIGLSFYIGRYLPEDYYGFFIISSAYLLIFLLLYFNKNRWLKLPFKNLIISLLLNNEEDN